MEAKVTLSIDFGYKNIGIALVRNQNGTNSPLFAGTIRYDPFQLSTKVGPRAELRRARRTRKTKKRRLNLLTKKLLAINLPEETVQRLITFCRRRGYSSLFNGKEPSVTERTHSDGEIIFRFSREEFFNALEKQIESMVSEEKRKVVLSKCEKILNRAGGLSNEIRPIRIDNRGASRCAWDGCESVPPRRDNALRNPLSQFVHTVFASSLRGNMALQQEVARMLDRVAELGKRLRHRGGPNPDTEHKVLKTAIGEELKLLKNIYGSSADLAEESPTPWTRIRRNIMNLIEQTGGRNRFCRYHSSQYVTHFTEGKPIPFKTTLTERDLVSRREEILFQKLWRYIEVRILPLAPNGIDRVIVERTAIDLLAGSRKQRQGIMNKEALEEMYQQGPRYGFKDNLEMLKAEFGGLCVYCGKTSGELVERDHLLPRSKFFFDSYLNIVPSCPSCNRTLKQAASPGGASLKIHEVAYDAFSKYLDTKFKDRPPHLFHTIKKGVLNLMREPGRTWEVERYLNLIANQFAQVVGTQRGPRPLARYISGKLYQKFGQKPQLGFVNGRHTAMWRKAAYPEFDKFRDKAEGGVINHALDALLMACDLPNLTALEGRDLRPDLMSWWVDKVRRAAPPEGPEGIPEIPESVFAVVGFENVLPGNYIEADLAKMNWNHKDTQVQRQGAYGWSRREDLPVQRVTAASVADELRKADKKASPELRKAEVKKILDVIAHPRLRQVLEESNTDDTPGARAAEALKNWLRKAIKGNLDKAQFSSHPADQSRAKILEDFVSGQSEGIPAVIGVQIFYPWLKSNTDLNRVHPKNGRLLHRYVADPANVAYIVAYRGSNGHVNREKPLTLEWRQSGAIIPNAKLLGEVPEGPLRGRALGEKTVDPSTWKSTLYQYLSNSGIAEYAFVSQGNVIVYENGKEFYIRNFSGSYGFKKSLLRGIVAVRPSPLTHRLIPNTKL
jgi:hypothetical protein